MQRVRSVRWAVLIGCAVGCGGPAPVAEAPPNPPVPTTPPSATAATLPPSPTPTATLIAPPPREIADARPPQGGTYPPRPYATPSFTWRTTPVSTSDPTSPTPPPDPATEPDPKTTDPKPPEPDKPFEWPKDIDGKNIEEWIEDFRNPDPSVRDTAVRVIPSFGPAAREAASRHIMHMIAEDPDPGVRMSAMTAAGLMGHESVEEIKPMVYALRMAIGRTYGGSAIRLFASRALATYGGEAVDAVSVLTKIHTDPWWETRHAVAQALGRIGAPQYDDPPAKDPRTGGPVPKRPADETARKYLIVMAQNDDCVAVRLEAVMSLITLGPPYTPNNAEYIAAIQPTLAMIDVQLNPKKRSQGEDDPSVQIWLHILHVMLDDRAYEETLPKIAGYLETPAAAVRAQALVAIGALGKRAAVQSVLAAVRDALNYEEEILVAAAVDCLMALGPDAAGVLPDVEKLKARTKNEKLKEIAEEGITVLSGKKTWDFLGKHSPLPTTYAGGVTTAADIAAIGSASDGAMDYTVGSALDVFGGTTLRYRDLV